MSMASIARLVVECTLAGVTCAGMAYHIMSVAAARRFSRSRAEQTRELPPISVLKPVRGVDPDAYENYASYCGQDYPEYEVLFGLRDPEDQAVNVIRRLQGDFPATRVRMVIVANLTVGANPKVCNLHNLLKEASHDLLLISDSDMRVDPTYLRQIAAYFKDPQVGLVTSPYRGAGAHSVAAALEGLGISTDFFPGVAVASQFASPSFGLGSTLALTRDTLARIGGLEELADYLADDFQIGNRVARLGQRVALSRYVVETMLPNAGLGMMLARRLRWARTLRTCQPAGFAGSVITFSTAWALALALASGFAPWALCLLAVQQAVRWPTAAYAGLHVLQDRELRRWFWLLPISDLLTFGLWLASWCGNTISWRGDRYRIMRGGRMVPIRQEEAPAAAFIRQDLP